MLKVSGTRIVVSIPRLVIAALLTGGAITATQIHTSPTQPQPIQVHAASAQQAVLSTPAAPVITSQVTPTSTTTTTARPQPKATAIPQSVTPAPAITPAPSASVTNLAPADPATSTSSTSKTPPDTAIGYTSTNWSGYMATKGNYNSVTGSWTIPTATGVTGKVSADATWIGIGGVTTSDLIQVGTTDTVSVSGKETSTAFYELLPQSARAITNLVIAPGDYVTASLFEAAPNHWSITITDATTSKSYTNTVAYTSSYSSAEWIEEDPSTITGQLPLDTFSPISFTDGAATTAADGDLTIAGSSAEPITLISTTTKQPIATPSALSKDGHSFTITRAAGQ